MTPAELIAKAEELLERATKHGDFQVALRLYSASAAMSALAQAKLAQRMSADVGSEPV